MPYDVHHALAHPDVAGWALGALDPDDAQAFETHLGTCHECQAAAAEFEAVAASFKLAAPAVEPPADLEARTVAAVQHAVLAASRQEEAQNKALDKAPDKASRWWHVHWTSRFMPLYTAVAAAVVTAAAFIGSQVLLAAAPAVAASYDLHGQAGSASATSQVVHGGYEVKLAVTHLPTLKAGQFFECWYAKPAAGAGKPELVSGGTFSSSNGSFTMWSAADPDTFKVMEITLQQTGATSQPGTVILSGTARSVHDDD